MENRHFIGQSKTDGILGEMEADNVRPVVFYLVQEGLLLQFSLRLAGRKWCKINFIQFITQKMCISEEINTLFGKRKEQ